MNVTKVKITAFLFLFLLTGSSSFAQFYSTQYRPANQQWQYLSTPHFKLVYAAGNDSSAMEMGRILEQQYHSVQQLVGGGLSDFPVILNSYNDRSNGFVTPTHFRSEIELPPIKGKSLSPQTGSWLENVGPHELVHAMQFSNLGGINLPKFVSFFSPDLARSFHGALPPGALEGIAVHHETEGVAPNGGRGNHPYFYNQFNAIFQSDDRWSMRQMVQDPVFTRPFNRHYLGGYEFTSWLQDMYGDDFKRELLDFFMDWPFLGYGVALRVKTGKWPGRLYKDFVKEKENAIDGREKPNNFTELDIPFSGKDIRRPKWLSDSTLIFYGSFYNARPGFYRYNLSTGDVIRLFVTNTVEDFQYDLSEDRTEMIYSYYDVSAVYDRTSLSDIVRYRFDTGERTQLTKKARVYAPRFDDTGIIALQSKPASSALVSVENPGSATSVKELLSLGDHEITAAVPNPSNRNEIAVIANKRGMQALWIADRMDIRSDLKDPPAISFEGGGVFDPVWHPQKERILFSSDFTGALQIYEFNRKEQTVRKVSGYALNAFEGEYHPEGDKIAFVIQKNNERIPAVLDRDDFDGEVIPDNIWMPNQDKRDFMNRPVVADSVVSESQTWESGTYRSGLKWLKPRAFLPVVEEISNREVYRAGLSLHSNDLLQSQNYVAELSYAQDRLWYDLSYQNKTFWPGFKTSVFSRPAFRTFNIETEEGSFNNTLLREERSFALSVPLRIRLNQNIFSTSLFLEPEIRQSQFRYFEPNNGTNSASDFGGLTISNLFTQFNFRLQQNIRDLQPNSGLILFSEVERFLNSQSLVINTNGNQIQQNFAKPTALRGGLFTYLSPLRHWNQSLRLGIRALTQTHPVFDNQAFVSRGFAERIFEDSHNLVSLDSRYTIPVTFVDDGWLLLPFYLANIYLVAFSKTVLDPTQQPLLDNSRSVFGLELRSNFRISNLSFDIGVGIGYEPTRDNYEIFFGYF